MSRSKNTQIFKRCGPCGVWNASNTLREIPRELLIAAVSDYKGSAIKLTMSAMHIPSFHDAEAIAQDAEKKEKDEGDEVRICIERASMELTLQSMDEAKFEAEFAERNTLVIVENKKVNANEKLDNKTE